MCADIRRRDGSTLRDRPTGHSDGEERYRKRVDVAVGGKEIGYVDKDGSVRKPDGIIFRGPQVGSIEENRYRGPDGIIFSGDEFGYVDEQGNVRQKDGIIFKGKIVGQVRGNPNRALGFFALRFQQEVDKFEELEGQIRSAEHRGYFLGRVHSMLSLLPKLQAIGDFDKLEENLKRLESLIINELNENLRKKEELCDDVERVSTSDWRTASEQVRRAQDKWKRVGQVPQANSESINARFKRAVDDFFARRAQYYEQRKEEQERRRREWEERQQERERKQREYEARKAEQQQERERKQREYEARKAEQQWERERKQREYEARKAEQQRERERRQREHEARKAEQQRARERQQRDRNSKKRW